jgi:hypothetical protein
LDPYIWQPFLAIFEHIIVSRPVNMAIQWQPHFKLQSQVSFFPSNTLVSTTNKHQISPIGEQMFLFPIRIYEFNDSSPASSIEVMLTPRAEIVVYQEEPAE